LQRPFFVQGGRFSPGDRQVKSVAGNCQSQNTERAYRGFASQKRANGARYGIKPPDTRIFSPLAVPRLSITIGHQMNEFNSFLPLRSHSIFRFPHIATNSSFKAHSKQRAIARPACCFFFDNGRRMFCPGSGAKQAQPRTQGLMDRASERRCDVCKRPIVDRDGLVFFPVSNKRKLRNVLYFGELGQGERFP